MENGPPSRRVLVFYLASLALLPWGWFPPFPLSQHNAQWSDAVFGVTALLWAAQKWHTGRWPKLQPIHIAFLCYFGAAALSFVFASPDKTVGALKLAGIAELCLLAVITTDLAERKGVTVLIARVVAVNSLLICAASVVGLLLFYAGVRTRLIGTYGDLIASPWYARAQAGTNHPNLLASYCIFAAAAIWHGREGLSVRVRRVAQAALLIAVVLTFSRAILGFALAALIRRADTPVRRAVTIACAVVFTAVIVTLSIWGLSINPMNPSSARIDESERASRRQSVMTSLRTLVENPLFGSGVGTHPGEYRGLPFDAHLTPLNIAATMGLPALAAFTAIFVLLWRGRRSGWNHQSIAIWSGLAGLALDALAGDIEDFRHLWVMTGLAAAQDSSLKPIE